MQFGSFSFSLLFDRLCDAQNAIRVKYQITLLNKSKWRPWAPNGGAGEYALKSIWRVKFHSILSSALLSKLTRVIYFTFVTTQKHTRKKNEYMLHREGWGRWIAIAKTFSILAKSQKWRAKATAKVQPKSSQMFDVRKWYTHKCLYLFSICASMYTCVCVYLHMTYPYGF